MCGGKWQYISKKNLHECQDCHTIRDPKKAIKGYQVTPELSIKFKRNPDVMSVKITTSNDCANFLRNIFNADTIEWSEEFIVVFLNQANQTIGYAKLSVGGLTSVVVDVRSVMTYAINSRCTALILAHNHPSGNLIPSQADKLICEKVKQACKIFDITVLDNLILTKDSHYSFCDNGIL